MCVLLLLLTYWDVVVGVASRDPCHVLCAVVSAVQIFSQELADGVGSPWELVAQTFFRFSTLSILPITLCSIIIYLLVS